ncbi:TIGR02117 family protein [uncultured Sphingomonas sp.]|uniref:TIGR02117 family protein n=1 Tax=uncultured Sphingomonas sp. TaxID=158754 RepID=UPI0035CC8628
MRELLARAARTATVWLAVLATGYAAAGMVGAIIPVNMGWRGERVGVRIYVEDNGVHTGLILPANAAGIDWRAAFPGGDLADPRYGALDWIAVGWGERAFYVETPTWADVRPWTVLRAAVGSSRTVLHVEHIREPTAGDDERAIMLTPGQYRRLAAFIRASRGARGVVAPGYARNDVFYDGRGRYSAINTCNAWTGRALAAAGVRVGAWTPFPVGVTGWF